MNQITITATIPAWLTSANEGERLMRNVREQRMDAAVSMLAFYAGDMSKGSCPWVRVGEADVTVRLMSSDAIVSNQLKALEAELGAARAEWMTKQQKILDQITKLQALPNDVKVIDETEVVPMAGMTGCGFNDVLEVTKRDWAK